MLIIIIIIISRVEIVWDNVDLGGWILGRKSGIPTDFFTGADDITKMRESKGSRSSDALPILWLLQSL